MKSKGGKIEYLCPQCGSTNIEKFRHAVCGVRWSCLSCLCWGPWAGRGKRKVIS